MPGRKSSSDSYRYGFNGKEKDNDVKGMGAQYDYGFRIYDPRIAKFLSVDPLAYSYPYFTPYQFAGNMPIAAIDLDGLEQHVVVYYKDQDQQLTKIMVRTVFKNNGREIEDQHIHKVVTKKDLAKGNVLVFEALKNKNNKYILSIVEKRNKPNSALTPRESNF